VFLDDLRSPSDAGWRRIGQDRLGETWLRESAGGQRVVLKRLAGLAAASGEAAELLDRVSAVPTCVAALGVEPHDGDLWVAYPFVTGRRPVEAAALGAITGADVERAVAELHSAGLVHGTLCDSNVRVTEAGEVRLLGAGLAGVGCLGAVRVATRADDRRDLAVLLRQMGTVGVAARPGTGPEGARRRRPTVGATAVVPLVAAVVMTAVLATMAAARTGSATGPARARLQTARTATDSPSVPRVRPVPPASSVRPCANVSLPGAGGATYLAVDMSGTGCAEPMAWSAGTIVTVSPAGIPMRFHLGRAGDVLLVGHWSCSRAELPALYRPGTGEVFYLRSWPGDGGAVTSEAAVVTGVRDGRARATGTTRCQNVEVVP